MRETDLEIHVSRAKEIAASLIAVQAETEERSYYSAETHQRIADAGLYDLWLPAPFGESNGTLEALIRIISALAVGCPSSAWQFCFGVSHIGNFCALYDREIWEEVLADRRFIAPLVGKPAGEMRRDESGDWIISGVYDYCSGVPYANYLMGQAFVVDENGVVGAPATFLARSTDWVMLDNWRGSFGMKGSGSQSVRLDNARIPARFVTTKNVFTAGEPLDGAQLKGSNPLHYGRHASLLAFEPAAIAIGAVRGALDIYREQMVRPMIRPGSSGSRAEDSDYRRWFGAAIGKLEAAEAMLLAAARRWTDAATNHMLGKAAFTLEEELHITLIASEAQEIVWDVMNLLWRSIGTSPGKDGQRFQRIFRDVATIRSHGANTFSDEISRITAAHELTVGSAQVGVFDRKVA